MAILVSAPLHSTSFCFCLGEAEQFLELSSSFDRRRVSLLPKMFLVIMLPSESLFASVYLFKAVPRVLWSFRRWLGCFSVKMISMMFSGVIRGYYCNRSFVALLGRLDNYTHVERGHFST